MAKDKDTDTIAKDLVEEVKKEFEKQKAQNKKDNESLTKKIIGYSGDVTAETVDTTAGLLGAGIAGIIAGLYIPVIGPAAGWVGGMGVYAGCRLYKSYRNYRKRKKK